MTGIRELAAGMLKAALAAGADEADLRVSETAEFTAKIRMGELELLKEAVTHGVALRVFRGGAKAVVSSTVTEPDLLARLAEEAVALASVSEPDEHGRLPEPELYATELVDLDLWDDEPPPDTAGRIALAREAEDVVLGTDPRIENSQGATYGRGEQQLLYLTSNGFEASQRGTSHSLSVWPVARDRRGDLVTELWGKRACHLADLESPAELAAEAARRVLRRLDARKVDTGRFPVIFEPRMAAGLVGKLFACIAGSAVWRKQSYLAERLGENVATDTFTLIDDPTRPRGLGSRPCDGEGLACRQLALVEDGVLRHFATDLESSRRLDLPATGHGNWGGGVSPSNLFLSPGSSRPDQILAATGRGLVVIEMLGGGFDPVSGHWSQGCTGLWIEDGEPAYPVSEITIAAPFEEVLKGIDMLGDDLDFSLGAVVSPSLRVGSMTVGGG